MKRTLNLFPLVLLIISIFFLVSCSNEPTDLRGTWKEIEPGETWHEAYINNNEIEIYWISTDLKALYWKGTYVAPEKKTNSYTWISNNTINPDKFYLMASDSPTKEFKYDKGILSYEASALGVTKIVKMKLIEKYQETETNTDVKGDLEIKLNIDGTIENNEIVINVCSDVETFSFLETFTIPDNYKWELHWDQACLPDLNIVSKTVNLEKGENILYALFINKNDTEKIYLYKIKLNRECICNEKVTKNPTCTEKGEITFTCILNSNHKYYKEISPLGHTEVIDYRVDSTCQKTGLTEGKHCSECGMIIVPQKQIPLAEHNFNSNGICKYDGCSFSKYGPIYIITLDANGGNVNNSSLEVQNGLNFTLPTPTKENYTFDGWYYNDVKVTSGIYNYTKNITLVAKWKSNVYTIDYNLEGGYFPNSISGFVKYKYNYGDKIEIFNPTRNGYEFVGWTWQYNTVPTKDVTIENDWAYNVVFVAHWDLVLKSSCYTYVYPDNIGTNPNYEKFNSSTSGTILPMNITDSNYSFSRWSLFYDEEVVDSWSYYSNYTYYNYVDLAGEDAVLYAILKFTYDDIIYEIIGDDELAVIGVVSHYEDGIDNIYANELIIPEFVTYDSKIYKVTTIFDFKQVNKLETIRLPKSLKTIYGSATDSCFDLDKVIFEKGTHLDVIYGSISQVDFILLPKTNSIVSYYPVDSCVIYYEGSPSDFVWDTNNAYWQKIFIEYNVDIFNTKVLYQEDGIFFIEGEKAKLVKVLSNDTTYMVPNSVKYEDEIYEVNSLASGVLAMTGIDTIYISSSITLVSSETFWSRNNTIILYVSSNVDTSLWSNGWDKYIKYVLNSDNVIVTNGVTYYLDESNVSILCVSPSQEIVHLLDKVVFDGIEYDVDPLTDGVLSGCEKIKELHLYSNASTLINSGGSLFGDYDSSSKINTLFIHGFDVTAQIMAQNIVFDENVNNIVVYAEANYGNREFIAIENPDAKVTLIENQWSKCLIFCSDKVVFNQQPKNPIYGFESYETLSDFNMLLTTDGAYLLGYIGDANNIIIPKMLKNNFKDYPVIAILNECFAYNGDYCYDSIYIPDTIIYIYGKPFIGQSEMYTVINIEHSSKPTGWNSTWNYVSIYDPWALLNINWNVKN